MTVPTIQFEAKVRSTTHRSAKSGDWVSVTLEVHPDDFPQCLRDMAVRIARVQCVMAEIGDDEQPVAPQKPKGGELARRAGILCGDERFQQWLLRHDGFRPFMEEGPHPTGPEFFADFFRWLCGIRSRAELDHNPEAAEKFKALEFEFKQAHGLVAERTR